MAGYIGSKAAVVSSGAERKKTFDITTSTTSLTGLSYTVGQIHVFHNGVRLVDGTDYTATNSTSITLTAAAENGDQVIVVSYATFQVADAYTRTEADAEFLAKAGDTMTGPLSVTGTVTATTLQTTAGGTVTTASGNDLNIVYPAGRSLFIKEGSETHVSVDNVGNVGIGTSLPRSSLDIDGGVDTHIRMQTNNTGTSSSDGLLLGLDGSTSALAYFWNYENAPVVIGTDNAERMRIDASGSLIVGNTSTSNIGTQSGIYLAYNGQLFVSHTGSSFFNRRSSTGDIVTWRYNNSNVGSVSTNGSSTSYNTTSDYRLKENVVGLTGATDRLKQLNPSRFNFIADADTTVDGFLAHEVQAVVPEAVHGTKDAMRDEEYEVTPAVEATYDDDGNELTAAVDAVMGTQSVPDCQGIDQSKLVPLLTAALQEALNKIDTMETRLAALEAV